MQHHRPTPLTCLMAAMLFLMGSASTFAKDNKAEEKSKTTEKPKMKFLGAYDAGQPGVNIYKLLDPTEDVVCYVLMPEVAGRKPVDGGKWIYDGNTVGSISCLKVRVPVIPIAPQSQSSPVQPSQNNFTPNP